MVPGVGVQLASVFSAMDSHVREAEGDCYAEYLQCIVSLLLDLWLQPRILGFLISLSCWRKSSKLQSGGSGQLGHPVREVARGRASSSRDTSSCFSLRQPSRHPGTKHGFPMQTHGRTCKPSFSFLPNPLAEKKYGLPGFVVPHWHISCEETFYLYSVDGQETKAPPCFWMRFFIRR